MSEPGEGIAARVMTEGDRHYLVLQDLGGALIRTTRDVIIMVTKDQCEALGVPVSGASVRGVLKLVPRGFHDELGNLSGLGTGTNGRL